MTTWSLSINELHIAKVEWFAEETLEYSVMTMLLIAHWYRELGLVLASKHYALAVGYVAARSEDAGVLRRLPQAALSAAEADYKGGAWLNFAVMARAGGELLLRLGSPDAGRQMKQVDRFAYGCGIILLFCDKFGLQGLAQPFRDLLEFFDFREMEEIIRSSSRENWQTADGLWDSIQEQLGGRPFGDVATTREIVWSALGVEWHLGFDNDYATAIAAEEFCAMAQVIQADLADVDLCLLPTTVRVAVRLEDRAVPQLDPVPSNEGRLWALRLPSDPAQGEGGSYETELMAVVFEILREASVAPSARFDDAVERVFERGLSAKVFVGQPYRVLFREFVKREDFYAHPRGMHAPPGADRRFEPKGHALLAWRDGPGPGYDAQDAKEAIERRYEGSVPPIRLTLARLAQDPEFCNLVSELREEGWKDWHILQAIVNLAVGERVSRALPPDAPESEAQRLGWQLLREEETPAKADLLPEDLFTQDALRTGLRMFVLLYAQYFGLEIHQRTPDFSGLERLLVARYRFKDDDAPHDHVFVGCGGDQVVS